MTLQDNSKQLDTARQAVDQQAKRNVGFELVRVNDLPLNPPRWLIRDVLEEDTMAMVFGDPGTGKSFLAVSMACCIATGTSWHGHEVKKGMVVYIAGEGHGGIGRRLKAWSIYHDVDLTDAPLHVSKGPAALTDPGSLAAVSEAIRNAHGQEVEIPRLVVIDTLARNFGAKDENSTQDMQDFINAVDELRLKHGCTVLLVHHTGHSDKGRARGAMALKGAADTEYKLSKVEGEIIRLEATKMKEGPCPPPLDMKLITVNLPLVDEYGVTATSAVLTTVLKQTRGRNSE